MNMTFRYNFVVADEAVGDVHMAYRGREPGVCQGGTPTRPALTSANK